MKITTIFFKVIFSCLILVQAPAFAGQPGDCIYQHSGVDLHQFKSSRHVKGFEKLGSKSAYAGSLKGIGGFHLQLFDCNHYGATLTILLGPDPDPETIMKSVQVLPGLLFAPVNQVRLKTALEKIQLDHLKVPQHLGSLAAEIGFSDITIQVVENNGTSLLFFSFHGG